MADTRRSFDIAGENIATYEWCRDNGHLDFVKRATKCDAYVQCDQWDRKVIAAMQRKRKPYITLNQILSTYATIAGEYQQRRGDVGFRPGPGGDPGTAKTLDKLWLNFSQSQRFVLAEYMSFMDGITRGRGFIDLRVDFTENMEGEAKVTYLNSKDVMLFPGDHGYDPDGWTGVMVAKRMSARDIAETYKESIDDILGYAGDHSGGSELYDWDMDSFGSAESFYRLSTEQRSQYQMLQVLERQVWETHTVEVFVDPMTGETREIPDQWEKDERHERIQQAIAQFGYAVVRRKVRKPRWTTSVGSLLLHNETSPMRHLSPIPFFPFLVGGKPLGVIEHLLSPQDLLNKTVSQELHIIAGLANSGWIVREGSLATMTAQQLEESGGRDGIVIEVNGDINSAIQKIKPNQVPAGMEQLSNKAAGALREISLVNPSMMGQQGAYASGDSIQTQADRGGVPLAPIFASQDTTRGFVARNWLDLTQQFVTEERVMYITTSPARTAEPEEVRVNEEQPDGTFLNDLTLGEYKVHVTNVKARDSVAMEQFDIMMQMKRNGAPLPWWPIIATLDILEDKDAIVETVKKIEGMGEPSEEDVQAKKLELQRLAAEVRDAEASADVKQAQAAKAQVLAQKEHQGGEDMLEQQKRQLDMRQQAEMFELKRQEAALKLRLQELLGEQKLGLERAKAQAAQDAQVRDRAVAQEESYLERVARQEELEYAHEASEMDLAQRQAEFEQKLCHQQKMHEMKMQELLDKQMTQLIAAVTQQVKSGDADVKVTEGRAQKNT